MSQIQFKDFGLYFEIPNWKKYHVKEKAGEDVFKGNNYNSNISFIYKAHLKTTKLTKVFYIQ